MTYYHSKRIGKEIMSTRNHQIFIFQH